MNITFDIPFKCDEPIRPHLAKVFAGEYDVPLTLPGGRKILDLGANCGAFALWAIHRWPGSHVMCYEPHPETYKILLENIEDYPQIKAQNIALGAPGIRILYDGTWNSGEASFHQTQNNFAQTGQHLEVTDPLTLPEADIIKLDIEGCELEVLSALVSDERTFELILLEYHNETLRRSIDSLLKDYILIGSEVQSILGRGVLKYVHYAIHEGIVK